MHNFYTCAHKALNAAAEGSNAHRTSGTWLQNVSVHSLCYGQSSVLIINRLSNKAVIQAGKQATEMHRKQCRRQNIETSK